MIALVEDKKDDIAALCRRFSIQRLDLFGSAATGDFDPTTSDLDFVVDLGEYDDTVHLRYLGLVAGLQDILECEIDVLTADTIRDPFLLAAIDRDKVRLYDARDHQEAA